MVVIASIILFEWQAYFIKDSIVAAFNISVAVNIVLNTTLYFLVSFIVACFLFRGRTLVKIYLALIYITLALIIETITGNICSWILSFKWWAVITVTPIAYLNLTSQLVFFVLICFLYRYRYRLKAYSYHAENRLYLLHLAIPFLSALLSDTFIIFYITNPESNILLFNITLFTLLAINIVQYVSFEKHEKQAHEDYSNKLLQVEHELKEEYYKSIEKYQEEIRTIKHDLKNQLITIGAYINSPENGKALEQVNLIIQDIMEKEENDFTRHKGINILLNTKVKEAQQAGVTCDFDISVSENMKFEEKDLGGLLGNVLDNAIEACSQHSGRRYCKLKIIYFNHALIIQSENSTNGEDSGFLTKKKDSRNHGLGIKSIESVVNTYNGDIEYAIEGRIFHIEITLWEQSNTFMEKI